MVLPGSIVCRTREPIGAQWLEMLTKPTLQRHREPIKTVLGTEVQLLMELETVREIIGGLELSSFTFDCWV